MHTEGPRDIIVVRWHIPLLHIFTTYLYYISLLHMHTEGPRDIIVVRWHIPLLHIFTTYLYYISLLHMHTEGPRDIIVVRWQPIVLFRDFCYRPPLIPRNLQILSNVRERERERESFISQ